MGTSMGYGAGLRKDGIMRRLDKYCNVEERVRPITLVWFAQRTHCQVGDDNSVVVLFCIHMVHSDCCDRLYTNLGIGLADLETCVFLCSFHVLVDTKSKEEPNCATAAHIATSQMRLCPTYPAAIDFRNRMGRDDRLRGLQALWWTLMAVLSQDNPLSLAGLEVGPRGWTAVSRFLLDCPQPPFSPNRCEKQYL
ncbi:hypothetical protein LX36DRAFT_7372 [Colletotrichum falcatum]|nr:hypothetical protein LX36DRAFT_7372 [Colletotrichum falcatum]